MKKIRVIWLSCIFLLGVFIVVGCNFGGSATQMEFTAVILEIRGTSVLVNPLAEDGTRNSSDQIIFAMTELPDIGAEVGDTVRVKFDGLVLETYPAQIAPSSWSLVERGTRNE